MTGKTFKIGKYLGVNFRRMPDAEGTAYLQMVIWYPRQRFTRLGYLYPSIRWF
jgi:hypothetical protein